MGDSIETEKYKLEQELKMIGPILKSKLQIAKDSLKEGDLEALCLLAEGKGTCCLQFNNTWNSLVSQEPNDKQSMHYTLCTLLALLWQAHELKQVLYDPIDLRIARSQQNKKREESDTLIIWGKDDENSGEDSEDEVALSEDGTNYLIGPYEIDLTRRDLYHPLFATYRRNCGRRQHNFLNSKHLPKARKLSGVGVVGVGPTFTRSVLETAAASLEELNIEDWSDAEYLEELSDLYMPKLRRLNLWLQEVDEETGIPPFVFLEGHIGLQYLRAHLPRYALESLISSNANTLLELHLKVGTAHPSWEGWPRNCRDLHKLLLSCKGTLRRLVLIRDTYTHTRASCKEQVEALKHNLPGLSVTCEYCCSK